MIFRYDFINYDHKKITFSDKTFGKEQRKPMDDN